MMRSSWAELAVETVAATGHDLNVHVTAPATYVHMLSWALGTAPPN